MQGSRLWYSQRQTPSENGLKVAGLALGLHVSDTENEALSLEFTVFPPPVSSCCFRFILFYVPACMHVHHMRAWYLQRSEEVLDPLGIELQVAVS